MSFKIKLILGLIYLSLLVIFLSVIGAFLGIKELAVWLDAGLVVFLLNSGFLTLYYGDYIKSKEFKIFLFGAAILVIGIMMKIMHWPFAFQLILIASLLFIGSYTYYIFRNKKKLGPTGLSLFFWYHLSVVDCLKLCIYHLVLNY